MRDRTSRFSLLALGLLTLVPVAAQAQEQMSVTVPGEPVDLVDRVVAVVGDSVVLLSQVVEEMRVVAQRPDVTIPTDPDERRQLMSSIVETLVNVQLIVQEAARDSTLLPEEAAVEAQMAAALDQVQSGFPTTEAFAAALAEAGMTPNQYRESLRARIRREQIQRLFLQRRLPTVPAVAVTEEEMRAVFDSQRGALQQRPEILRLEQVIMAATASDSAWASAKEEADSLRAQVGSGADFSELAREHSDDAGTAANGGDLDWFRRGVMVREFEDAAFSLPDGAVSQPVRTDYGWHIIKVERSRPGEVRARHILITPPVGPADLDRARLELSEVATQIRGGASVEELHNEMGEEGQPWTFQVSRNELADQLPPGYAQALALSSEGQVIGPFQTTLQGRPFFSVVKVAEVREAGELTFDDVRDQIRTNLQQQKRVERLWESLRAQNHVEIRF
jgi:peptidyl-prolyl cis-trans isomerase SurA